MMISWQHYIVPLPPPVPPSCLLSHRHSVSKWWAGAGRHSSVVHDGGKLRVQVHRDVLVEAAE